jgi:PmbA protein
VAPEKQKKSAKNKQKFDETEFCALTSNIIIQAKKMGATAVEVDACASSGFSINVRKSEVETIEHSNGKTLHITVYFGYRTGSATTSDLKPESIHTAIEKACHIARFTSEDPFVGLADPELMAYDYQDLDLDLYHPWPIKVEEAIELAKNAEDEGFSYDKRIINSEGASLDTFETFDLYANSHGFCGTTATTKHSFGCSFIAKHKNDMQRDYYYTVAHEACDLENADHVARQAAKRTINRLNAQRITTRECPVIFAPEIAGGLIGNFVNAIHGSNIYRKSSFLLDHLHKPVLAKHINIEENPHIPKALGSAAFDGEGVKLFRNDVVVDGILQHYVLDSYSARKLKMKTTGNAGGIHNLIVKTSDLDLDRLLKKMGTGLLVTELMGSGANIVTGDYSRGVFGYWIENGFIQHPVTGVTIAGNLKDILLNIVAIGNDVDHRSNILTGSILLDNMTVAGK